MALSALRSLRQLQGAMASPALSRLLPQLWSLGQQTSASPASQWNAALHASAAWRQESSAEDANRKALANRLLYRSRQRGFLELDLLVGLWAEKTIPFMNTEQLTELAVVLDQENPELFKWLTGQLPPSEEMQRNSAYLSLREHVKGMMDENRHPAAAAAGGAEWVRGWGDDGRWNNGEVKTGVEAVAAARSASSGGSS